MEENIFFDDKIKNYISKRLNLKYNDAIQLAQEVKENPNLDLTGKIEESKQEYFKFFLYSLFRLHDIIEILWSQFFKLANKGFKERMLDNTNKFNQYLWEIYLGIYLINHGIDVKTNNKNEGPDFNFDYFGKKVYIECVAPTQGEKQGLTYLPSIKFDVVDSIPLNEVKVRIFNAIKCKSEKYTTYLDDNNCVKIKRDSIKIIAINTSCMSQYGSLFDYSGNILKIVCEEKKVFENFNNIDVIILSHKSIFDYNDNEDLNLQVEINNKRDFV